MARSVGDLDLELDVKSVLFFVLDIRSVLRFEPDDGKSVCFESETRSLLELEVRSVLDLELDIRSAGGGVGFESEFVEAADVVEVLEEISLEDVDFDWLR